MLYHAEIIHLIALLCTLTVEGVGMALWSRFAYPLPWRAIGIALVANLVIHTIFWYSQPFFVGQWPTALYCAEAVVVLFEGAGYAYFLNLKGITPWLLSFLLNLASLLAGLYLWQFLL